MTNQNSQAIRSQIEQLLGNKDLEIELEDSNKEYSIVYSTTILAQETEDVSQLTRTYWINQHKNGGQISSPWGSYEHAKQISLVSNLIQFANYRIKKIINGWEAICKKCGNKQNGPIWRNSPKSCEQCSTQYALGDKIKSEQKI